MTQQKTIRCHILYLCYYKNMNDIKLFESGEMYLETILILSKQQKEVRSIDISRMMNFSKPSVSRAVNKLKDFNYIYIDTNGLITLTEKGKELANNIYDKHIALTNLLKAVGVDEKRASEDACRIEHVISDESFLALRKYFNL